jgi:hypothetical protein
MSETTINPSTSTTNIVGMTEREACLVYEGRTDIVERFYKVGQGYDVVVIMALPATTRPAQKLRGHIHVNAYADQSWSTVDLWTAAGWTEVDRAHGAAFFDVVPSYQARDDMDKHDTAGRVLSDQIIDMIRVIS